MKKTFLAVPVAADTVAKAVRDCSAAAAAGAEIIELRTDYIKDLSAEAAGGLVKQAKAAVGIPLIVTCRAGSEGGAGTCEDSLRAAVLSGALDAGADYIDFEYESFRSKTNAEPLKDALSRNPGARLILSAHSFSGPFENIKGLYRRITKCCPQAIPKLVYTAGHINDCFEAMDLLHETSGDRIILCMGQAGLITRVTAAKLGCFLTFASLDDDRATAAGQLSVQCLLRLYRCESIGPHTTLYGVIGSPVAHSASPAVHNACLAADGMDAVYLPLLVEGEVAEFDSFLHNVLARPWLNFRGLSITIPHKKNALAYVKSAGGHTEPLAERIGAANTILIGADGAMSACNTDYAGAMDAVTSAMGIDRTGLRNMPVAVIGAGGVARAIVAGLADAGAAVTVYNRTESRGRKLAAEFGCEFHSLGELSCTEPIPARLLVNCTSVGMHPNIDRSPVPAGCLSSDIVVFDTVYNPVNTRLLREAAAAGAKTINGMEMFVNQALAQYKLFTGRKGDANVMREAAIKGSHLHF